MDKIMDYVKPELAILAIVLYMIGVGLKQSEKIADKYIPITLGIIGILICALYVFATSHIGNYRELLMALFVSVTQGILVAGASTYVHQIQKQNCKKE
ncbi:MAG: phage holin family protein [Lachnospiraceae bacterium]